MNTEGLPDNNPYPIEILIDPSREVLERSRIAPGLGIVYRYHPEAARRLADGFPRFIQSGIGRLVIARSGHDIVAFAAIARPDSQERWGTADAPELWELSFIEVSRGWRQQGLGRKLLRACFADGAFDHRIVLATAYAWHWDLQETGLSKAAYGEMLLKFFGTEDFRPLETDEPNIQEDPASRLLARIGPHVRGEVATRFQGLLQIL